MSSFMYIKAYMNRKLISRLSCNRLLAKCMLWLFSFVASDVSLKFKSWYITLPVWKIQATRTTRLLLKNAMLGISTKTDVLHTKFCLIRVYKNQIQWLLRYSNYCQLQEDIQYPNVKRSSSSDSVLSTSIIFKSKFTKKCNNITVISNLWKSTCVIFIVVHPHRRTIGIVEFKMCCPWCSGNIAEIGYFLE